MVATYYTYYKLIKLTSSHLPALLPCGTLCNGLLGRRIYGLLLRMGNSKLRVSAPSLHRRHVHMGLPFILRPRNLPLMVSLRLLCKVSDPIPSKGIGLRTVPRLRG